jgi:competence protein ComGC
MSINPYEPPQIPGEKRADDGRLRNRFTIVDLLVVVAVIFILIGLLLPALESVPRARSTGPATVTD